MTLEEIKRLMPHFQKWKDDIALLYGRAYASKYCDWKRFLDHVKVLQEVFDENNDLMDESNQGQVRTADICLRHSAATGDVMRMFTE